jgi:hypothetical protein
MVMFRDQDAGQSHNIQISNSSFERGVDFKYFGTTLSYQNSVQEEIKSRLKSGNACFRLVQNLLSSSLLSKNLKVKIIFPVVLYGCETWSLTLREKRRLRVSENRVLIFGRKRDEVTGESRKLHNLERNYLYYSPNIVRVIEKNEMGGACSAYGGE